MYHYHSMVAVAIGGAAGSLARWAALEITAGDPDVIGVDTATQRAALATLAINVLGSTMLGLLIARRQSMNSNQFLAADTGFAGGLTTFSTFAVSAAQDLDAGNIMAAMTNGVGTAFAVVLAAGIGYRLGLLTR